MATISYLSMSDRPDTFEVYSDGASVGIVWKLDGMWYADPLRIANPKVAAADRDEAARELIRLIR